MDNNFDDYSTLRNDIDEYMKLRIMTKKLREENLNKERNEIFYQDCCICYKDSSEFIIKTKCNHFMCMPCLYKLTKHECPMCRQEFPDDIKKLLPKNNNFNNGNYGVLRTPFSWNGTPMSTSYGLRLI
tara:strand:- start:1936 stop:2319 length:384 start_codon:yes stop_codon:yes gene_type:complete